MTSSYVLRKLTKQDLASAFSLYETTIPFAFQQENLGHLTQTINHEIDHKKTMLQTSLSDTGSDLFFWIAINQETVIGAISYGQPGEEIRKCMDETLCGIGEIGSLYVAPDKQNQGVGSALIEAMKQELKHRGIKSFCLDSGYKHAQQRWLRKFGNPHKIVKDFWGPGADHYIWISQTG